MLTPAQNAFLKAAIPAAQATQQVWNVPASVTVAQACLESGYGDHMPLHSFNCFGIKAVPGQAFVMSATTEIIRGVVQHIQAAFAKYDSLADGFAAHARLLAQSHLYEPAMMVRGDAIKFCGALKACGYSTNPYYAQQLISIIKEWNLTQYDKK